MQIEECISQFGLLQQKNHTLFDFNKTKQNKILFLTVQEMGKSKIRVLANLAIVISICDVEKKIR